VFAGKVVLDPCVEVHDVKALLAKSMAALCATQPDVSNQLFPNYISNTVNELLITVHNNDGIWLNEGLIFAFDYNITFLICLFCSNSFN